MTVRGAYRLAQAGLVVALPVMAQQEVAFDVVTACGSRQGDTMIWLRFATVSLLLWKLTTAAYDRGMLRGRFKRKRYWWPTLMVGWAVSATVMEGHSFHQPWEAVFHLISYCFYVVNAPALLVLMSATLLPDYGLALAEVIGVLSPPLSYLAFWGVWYGIIGVLDRHDYYSRPLLLGIAVPSPPSS